MKDADRAIEKVLDGLRCASPLGLESRVLRAVRERRVTPVFWRKPAFAVVSAAVLAGSFFVGLTYNVRQEPIRLDAGVRVPVLEPPTLPVPAVYVDGVSVPTGKLAADVRSVPRGAAARRISREVSYPAPPLPLTDQERLLLQVAHHRTAEAVESLTPETLVAQAARDKEEFSKFFDRQTGGTNQ